MEPVPSSVVKTYPQRRPLQQFRFAEATAFRCFRCCSNKKSTLITVYTGDWSRRLCNGCYGRLLSLHEIKAGTSADDERAEQLAVALLETVALDDRRQAERLFRASDDRASGLTQEAIRFIATAEHVALQLEAEPQLEWSPAIIGLCKAVEAEVVVRIMIPLAQVGGTEDLSVDERDKDIERVATFCADPKRKSPELGAFAHFLQTFIFSQQRRNTSPLLRRFRSLAAQWVGSNWLLDPLAFHRALTKLTTSFRNRAAHIDELGKNDYFALQRSRARPGRHPVEDPSRHRTAQVKPTHILISQETCRRFHASTHAHWRNRVAAASANSGYCHNGTRMGCLSLGGPRLDPAERGSLARERGIGTKVG